LNSQILTWQSLPPVTNLLNDGVAGPLALVSAPGAMAGAQLTALTPMPCAGKIWWLHVLSLNSRTDTLPSLEAQASRQPASCGAHATRFTLAVWRANS
jgi:hypothetical protein